ncbi:MAG: hypothetical protein ABJN14_03850 [Paracoccaceae bacterium]
MQIVLHAGAHDTEADRLFKTLLRNKNELAKRGISIPGPSRYRPILRDTLGAMADAPAAEDARDILLDAILDDEHADQVILCHPHIFGAERACLRNGELYALAPERMQLLTQLFKHDQITLFLAIRNPASFLPTIYNASPQTDMDSFLRGYNPFSIRWSDTLQSIREAAPRANLVVWCFEDMPLIWAQIIREMAGLDHGEKIIGEFDLLSQIMSPEGMKRFQAYLKKHPNMNEIQKHRVISAFLDKFALQDVIEEELEAPGWTDDLVEELTAIYDDDVSHCANIPGVQMILP